VLSLSVQVTTRKDAFPNDLLFYASETKKNSAHTPTNSAEGPSELYKYMYYGE